MRNLTQVRRRSVEELKPLISEDRHAALNLAQQICSEAREFGLGLRDYLTLAIDVNASENAARYLTKDGQMTGYEAALSYLNLPVRDDLSSGVVLDAASDTFQTYPGTRMMFPEVVDDVVQWKYRQPMFENTSALVAQSRTINGVEMITTLVDDKEDDYKGTAAVAELGRVPVRTIRTTQQSVGIFKHGSGLRYSYEFARRARIDLLTPYQNRMVREAEMSKVLLATSILVNGDGVAPAATEVNQSTYDSSATSGTLSRKALLAWFIARAKAGVPIDTVVGNWDAYVQWLMLFAMPVANTQGLTEGELLARTGFQIGGVPLLNGTVNFALSSGVSNNKLVGYSKGDTLEELIEAGSDISESERSITNQSISFVKTVNAGYRLAFPDTRSVLNFGA